MARGSVGIWGFRHSFSFGVRVHSNPLWDAWISRNKGSASVHSDTRARFHPFSQPNIQRRNNTWINTRTRIDYITLSYPAKLFIPAPTKGNTDVIYPHPAHIIVTASFRPHNKDLDYIIHMHTMYICGYAGKGLRIAMPIAGLEQKICTNGLTSVTAYIQVHLCACT